MKHEKSKSFNRRNQKEDHCVGERKLEHWIAWIKAHAGNYGNELADRLAKEASRNSDICYNRFLKSEIERQEREKSIEKWQKQWDISTKGSATEEFFPNIKERLKIKINLTPNFTATITVHGKTRSYLNRFKIIESPECPCANVNQTVDHLIYDCNKLNNERDKLIAHILKEGNWPIRKNWASEKIFKTSHSFYKLNWLWKTVNEKFVHNQCSYVQFQTRFSLSNKTTIALT